MAHVEVNKVKAKAIPLEVWTGPQVSKSLVKLPITGLARPFGRQDDEAPRISRQSAHEFGKVINTTHRPPLPPPGDIPRIYPFISLADPRSAVRPEI
jgi:hypothetical protein